MKFSELRKMVPHLIPKGSRYRTTTFSPALLIDATIGGERVQTTMQALQREVIHCGTSRFELCDIQSLRIVD